MERKIAKFETHYINIKTANINVAKQFKTVYERPIL